MAGTCGFFPRASDRLIEHRGSDRKTKDQRTGTDPQADAGSVEHSGRGDGSRDGSSDSETEEGSSEGTREDIRLISWRNLYTILAQLGWKPYDAEELTLREVIIFYDNHVVAQWDHTASILAMSYNHSTICISLWSKAKPESKTALDFHPYRKQKRKGAKITSKNFNVLYMVAEATIAQ